MTANSSETGFKKIGRYLVLGKLVEVSLQSQDRDGRVDVAD